MANRQPGALPAMTPGAILEAALGRIAELERRLQALEARGDQQLPGDFRFETSDDGASVAIRRVSTDASQDVAGPL